MKTLLVKAASPDTPCPKIRTARLINRETGRDSTMIYHDEVCEVENVRYYRRRIAKGDLVEVKPEAKAVEVKPTASSKPAPKKKKED